MKDTKFHRSDRKLSIYDLCEGPSENIFWPLCLAEIIVGNTKLAYALKSVRDYKCTNT